MESIQSKYKIKAFAESRIGGRGENQDSYGYADTPRGFLAVVCDGMGGANGGKTASTIAVKVILNYVLTSDEQASLQVVLSKAISEANRTIISYAQNNPELTGMGTTVTALLLNDDNAYIAHVGDSRIYQLRNGKRIFRTFDHSMVFELVKNKVITEEQARLSSQSNIITRALGINKDVIVDTRELSYRKNDCFILCSDGFHSAMNEKDFIGMMGKSGDINIILDNASERIDNIGKSKGGGHDNLTAFVIKPQKNSNKENKKRRIVNILSFLLGLTIVFFTFYFYKADTNGFVNKERDTAVQDTTVNAKDSIQGKAADYNKTKLGQEDSETNNSKANNQNN